MHSLEDMTNIYLASFSETNILLRIIFSISPLTHCLPVSADNLCKQFGPRSCSMNRRAGSGFKLFDILVVFLKEFLEKVYFEKNQQTTKKHEKLASMQRVPNRSG